MPHLIQNKIFKIKAFCSLSHSSFYIQSDVWDTVFRSVDI